MPPEKLMRQRKVVTSIQPARSTDLHAETIQATSESSMVVSAATPDRKLGLRIPAEVHPTAYPAGALRGWWLFFVGVTCLALVLLLSLIHI